MSRVILEDGGFLDYPDYEDNQMPPMMFGRGLLTKQLQQQQQQQPAGRKDDGAKAPWHLLPFDVLTEVVEILRQGAIKYEERNWETGLAYSRTFAAALRHMVAFWRGEEYDKESGRHHLAHAICELMFTAAHAMRKTPGCNDRPLNGRLPNG